MRARILPFVAAPLAALPFAARLLLLRVREFDPDELEHVHNAWNISQGLVMYRDFFEHHTPWLHFFLSAYLPFFDTERNAAAAAAFLTFARLWMWVFTGTILWLTFRLGRLWRGSEVAWLGTALLGLIVMFLQKSLEIRPDGPAAACLLSGLLLLVRAARGETSLFGWSGFLLGASVMLTQKTVFGILGVGVFVIAYLASPASASVQPVGARIRHIAAFSFAGFLPTIVTLVYFWWKGALGAFWRGNFDVVAGWVPGSGPGGFVLEVFRDNPVISALGMVWCLRVFVRGFTGDSGRSGDLLLSATAIAMAIGLFLLPEPTRHYFVLFFPLVALFAAEGLVAAVAALARDGRGYHEDIGFLLLGAGALALVWRLGHPGFAHPGSVATLAVGTALLAGTLAVRGLQHPALAVVALGICIHPLALQRRVFEWRNDQTLAKLRFVQQNTRAADTVMDGYTGLGAFRRHAYYYWIFLGHLRQTWPEGERDRLLEALRSGAATPRLIFSDVYLRTVSPEISAYLDEHYAAVATDLDPIRVRLPDSGAGWNDEAERTLDEADATDGPAIAAPRIVIGPGWSDVVQAGAEPSYRQNVSRRPTLIVPVRTPQPFFATLVAWRLGSHELPSLTLSVNGTRTGTAPLQDTAGSLRFTVPAESLRPGFNTFELSYPRELREGGANAPKFAARSLTLTAVGAGAAQ